MGKNRAGTQKNLAKSLFLNDGSGKTNRERDILLFFVIAEIVRRTFLFQAYYPDTLRFISAFWYSFLGLYRILNDHKVVLGQVFSDYVRT